MCRLFSLLLILLVFSISCHSYAEADSFNDRFAMEWEHGSQNLTIDSFGFWHLTCFISKKSCMLKEENFDCANKSKGEIGIAESPFFTTDNGSLNVLKITQTSLKFSVKDGDSNHYICSMKLGAGSKISSIQVRDAVCESDSDASKWYMPKKEIDLFERCTTTKAHGQL